MSAVTDQPRILTAADRAAPALADAPTGQRVRVLRLQAPADGGANGWQQQLADLGFTPGETAMVMRRGWPSGDPLAVRIGSSERAGVFERVSPEAVRPSFDERRANPRSSSAKLRWAVKARAAP